MCTDEERVPASNDGVAGFNENTHNTTYTFAVGLAIAICVVVNLLYLLLVSKHF
jgi:hypothetical protein